MKVNKPLLILGCQRSGTTLLAAMLGRHSEINMLFENTTDATFKLIGKKYSGNKVLAWRQIRWNERASKFGHLVNRIVNFDFFKERRRHRIRVFPLSKLSVKDYVEKDAEIITIKRRKEEVVNSITSRTELSEKQASKEYDLAIKEIERVEDMAVANIDFADLVNDPIDTLKEICDGLDIEFEESMLEGPKYNIMYPNSKIIKSKSKNIK